MEHSDINLKTWSHINRGALVKHWLHIRITRKLSPPSLMLTVHEHQVTLLLAVMNGNEGGKQGFSNVKCASESPRIVLNHRSLGPTPWNCDSMGGGKV